MGRSFLLMYFLAPYHKAWCIMTCVNKQEYELPRTSLIIGHSSFGEMETLDCIFDQNFKLQSVDWVYLQLQTHTSKTTIEFWSKILAGTAMSQSITETTNYVTSLSCPVK